MINRIFRDERVLMLMLYFSYVLKESFILFESKVIHPFPFNPGQYINKQSWIMMGGEYLIFATLTWIIICRPVKTLSFYIAAGALSFFEFIEYWLTYNHRWFEISIAINITIFRFIILSLILCYHLIKWKKV